MRTRQHPPEAGPRRPEPRPAGHDKDALNQHAERQRRGFAEVDRGMQAQRRERAAIVHRFLAIMAAAKNPGLQRSFGSTARQLTGQRSEAYWSTVLADEHGHHRVFVVSDDGRHAWGDESHFSDRPRAAAGEIAPTLLRRALGGVLKDQHLTWESPAAAALLPVPKMRPVADSAAAELRRREWRYGALMALRIVLLLVAAALVLFEVSQRRTLVATRTYRRRPDPAVAGGDGG